MKSSEKIIILLLPFLVIGVLLIVYLLLSPASEKPVPSDQQSQKIEKTETPQDLDVLTNSIGMKFAKIPSGSFTIGSSQREMEGYNEGPQRTIKLTESFYMGVYEVTQAEYEKVTGSNPSYFKGNRNFPVEKVSWNNAVSFCKKMSLLDTSYTYRLPTEAEWEYSCRAGSTTAFYWGDEWDDAYCWNATNSDGKTHEVGKKKPNAWGLCDMSGNVCEWCSDWYTENYPTVDQTNPLGSANGSYRVFRGGSWSYSARHCRSANRNYDRPGYSYYFLGFRVVAVRKGQ